MPDRVVLSTSHSRGDFYLRRSTGTVTTQHQLDNGRVWNAIARDKATKYLYGLGSLGKETNS